MVPRTIKCYHSPCNDESTLNGAWTMPQTLLPIFAEESTPLNNVLSFEKRDGTVWYFHGCMPVFSHDETDHKSFNMFTSQLVDLLEIKPDTLYRAIHSGRLAERKKKRTEQERTKHRGCTGHDGGGMHPRHRTCPHGSWQIFRSAISVHSGSGCNQWWRPMGIAGVVE